MPQDCWKAPRGSALCSGDRGLGAGCPTGQQEKARPLVPEPRSAARRDAWPDWISDGQGPAGPGGDRKEGALAADPGVLCRGAHPCGHSCFMLVPFA